MDSAHDHKANPKAWIDASIAGLVTFLFVLPAFSQSLPGDTAFNLGLLVAPTVSAVVLVGLIASHAQRHLHWWFYALAVPSAAALLTVVLNASSILG